MTFKDHFSGHAGAYARYRPGYPGELFQFLATVTRRREVAWDCATGNGQAALSLAESFQRIVATDASIQQLRQAAAHPSVFYANATAENTPMRDCSVDLTTVAQALHWLNWEGFYAEVRRVSRPQGVLAVWTYSRLEGSRHLNAVLDEFYDRKIGPYWPPERRYTEVGYRNIPFPFPPLEAPEFEMREAWDLDRMLGYLRTWSATRRYLAAHGSDPVSEMEDEFREAWGADEGEQALRWKLHLLVGRAG